MRSGNAIHSRGGRPRPLSCHRFCGSSDGESWIEVGSSSWYSDHPYITTAPQPNASSRSHKPESHHSHASRGCIEGQFFSVHYQEQATSTSLIEWKCLTFYRYEVHSSCLTLEKTFLADLAFGSTLTENRGELHERHRPSLG